ncbi:MAG TPA: hypothetical protein DG754_09455 [Bacteroidales bacterium]|nr:hypothetical protein [Bacteroidales bacterium]
MAYTILASIVVVSQPLSSFQSLDSIAQDYNNAGVEFAMDGDFAKASEFLLKSIAIRESAPNFSPQKLANGYLNLGNLKFVQNQVDSALFYYHKAETALTANDSISNSLLGTVYVQYGTAKNTVHDSENAIVYIKKGISLLSINLSDNAERVIAAYQGQEVKLAWQGVDGDGQGLWSSWFIDYVTVGNAKGAVSFDGKLQHVSKSSGGSSIVSERSFSRDGSVAAVSNKSAKAFVSYSIYLDNMTTPHAENVSGTSFEFTGLTVGNHTAGVQRVYETGASEIVMIEFTTTADYTVTLTVIDGETPIEGATVNFDGVDYTTDVAGIVAITDLIDGAYAYIVSMTGYHNATGEIVVDGADVEESIALTPTGIESGFLSNLKVYPNPFSNEISITSANRVNRVIITSIVGQCVMDITLNGSETINTSELSNGIYLVTFEGHKGEHAVRKMIKK